MIKIQTSSGKSIGEGLSAILRRVANSLNNNSGAIASDVMTKSVKNWVQLRFSSSRHWDPSKVTHGQSIGVVGVTNVDIAGAGRAYHDVVIKPVRSRALTIPIHADAYHHQARDFNDLFKLKGKNILARNVNGQLVAMFVLSQSAFQKQDKFLMPTDDHLAGSIFKALITKLKL